MTPGDSGTGGPDISRSEFLAELQLLYRAAGRPAYRKVSDAIRDRDDMPDTVSHETVSAIIRGAVLPRWIKVECVVRQLATMAVVKPDTEAEVRRFHLLWSAEDDRQRGRSSGHSAQPNAMSAITRHPGRPFGEGLPPQNLFIGRQDLLDRIVAELAVQLFMPVVLHGPAGMGKTHIAIEYVHRYRGDYDHIWWIPAEQPGATPAEMTRIADHLGIQHSRSIMQTVRTVLNRLESGDAGRWLIVFDNAGPATEVAEFLPTSGGDVIITTRDTAGWRGRGRLLEVNVFERAESVELLRTRGHRISSPDADKLAEFLGDMPLALEQVAAMQSYTRAPVGEYLEQLESRAAAVLSQQRPAGYSQTVASAFGLAYDRLRHESLGAARLLDMLSCLAAEPIPLALLRRAGGTRIPAPLGRIVDDQDQLETAVGRLGKYGLARVGDDAQRLEVHRLVQLIVRDTLSEAELRLARASAHRLLSVANPGRPDDQVTWDLHSQLRRHIRVSGLVQNLDGAARAVVLDQIRYLALSGDPNEAVNLAQEVLPTWSEAGAPDEQTYTVRQRLGEALIQAGRYTEAMKAADALWQSIRDDPDFGPGHDLAVDIARQVGQLYRISGRYGAALDLEQGVLALLPPSPGGGTRRIWAQNNLAVSYRQLGRYDEALRLDQGVRRERARLLGATHNWTLLSGSNIARDLYGLGRYAEALAVMETVLPQTRRELGARHDFVLLGTRTLAVAARKSGDLDRALAVSNENQKDCLATYPDDHEATLAAIMTYANTLCAAGQFTKAWDLFTMIIYRYRRSFGVQNPLSLAAYINLGIVLRAQGERNKAQQIDHQTLSALRRTVGPRHPYTLAAAVGLANDFATVPDEHESAIALLADTWAVMHDVHGENHPDTLTCAVNYGLLGARDDKRIPSADDALARLEQALGVGHPHVSALRQGLHGEVDVEPPPT
ncbi:tetratricopeptide (TPR) repeat protein [Catenuloplanes nepalensis]|uniref:Tetratricopeptide (TPR) repeat protein n=1 Tax=Catenuloplanes nepalensis TaxID=587533 RepID=A0ABT9N113_9ACTN|nr:FxSxx-COOH system tetratricopeptide repeat protein [Catenuloplanes nepalensis]MDP9797359.1 tetratricopeptide (TPR) repeat protein [Catenuloplanes nepalensis]